MNGNGTVGNKEAILKFPDGKKSILTLRSVPRLYIEKMVEQEFDVRE